MLRLVVVVAGLAPTAGEGACWGKARGAVVRNGWVADHQQPRGCTMSPCCLGHTAPGPSSVQRTCLDAQPCGATQWHVLVVLHTVCEPCDSSCQASFASSTVSLSTAQAGASLQGCQKQQPQLHITQ